MLRSEDGEISGSVKVEKKKGKKKGKEDWTWREQVGHFPWSRCGNVSRVRANGGFAGTVFP